jgi:serine/threonine-protein kinase
MDTLPGAPPAGAAPAPRGRVLLAGVDESTRAVVSVALGGRYEVEVTATRAAVLEAARGARPDLVLLDCQGAESQAASFVSDLRSDPLTRDAKVMLVVDWQDTSVRKAGSAGADESLAAPFSPLQLQVKLRKLLGAEAVGW